MCVYIASVYAHTYVHAPLTTKTCVLDKKLPSGLEHACLCLRSGGSDAVWSSWRLQYEDHLKYSTNCSAYGYRAVSSLSLVVNTLPVLVGWWLESELGDGSGGERYG